MTTQIQWNPIHSPVDRPERYKLVRIKLSDGRIKKGWCTEYGNWDGLGVRPTDKVIGWVDMPRQEYA